MVRKKAYFIILWVLFASNFSATAQEQDQINILFIGNSFTFRHDLNLLVEELVHEGKPDLNIYTERAVYGGQSLFQHTEYYFTQTFIEQSTIEDAEIERRIAEMESLLTITDPPQEFVHFWEDIRGQAVKEFPISNIENAIKRHRDLLSNNPRRKWDYVVFQTWQDEYPDLNDGYAKYAKCLGAIAREQGAKVIFYMTAPDFQNEAPVTGPVNQADYEEQIGLILDLAKEFQPFAVVPVSMAINTIQQGGTDLTFRYVNDFHPNQRTAFLTANMFYDALFNESTEGFEFNTVTETNPKGMEPGQDPDGNPATVVFEEEEKIYLQQMANNTVQNFVQSWKGPDPISVSAISIINAPSNMIYLGENYQLEIAIEPLYATNRNVVWEVTSGNAVTVDENGLFIAVASGTANIVVTTTDGGFTDNCSVTVIETFAGSEIFTFQNRAQNTFIKPIDSSEGAGIVQTFTESDATKWVKVPTDGDFFYLMNLQTGLYLQSPADAQNEPLIQSSETGEFAQWSFRLVPDETIWYFIDNRQGDNRKIKIEKNPAVEGDIVTFSTLSGQLLQWSIHPETQGTFWHDATLSDLTVDGTTVFSFDPAKLTYDVVLPAGTVDVPEVAAITNVAIAGAVINQATSLPGSATVTAENGNTQVYTVNFSVDTTTSLEDYRINNVKVYPNPVSDKLHFILPESFSEKIIIIYNTKGQQLISEKTLDANLEIDAKQFKSEDILLIKVFTEQNTSSFKIAKK